MIHAPTFVFRASVLAFALSVCPMVAHVGVQAGATELAPIANVGAAHARKWKLYTKRTKGKTKFDRKMNESFLRIDGGGSPAGVTVETVIELTDSDLTIPTTVATASDIRHRFTAQIAPGSTLLTLTVVSEAGSTAGAELAIPEDAQAGERIRTRLSDGTRVNVVMLDAEGAIRITVRSADDAAGVTALHVSDGQTEGPATFAFTQAHFVDDWQGETSYLQIEGHAWSRTTTVYGPDGSVLDTELASGIVGVDDGDRSTVQRLRIAETNRGDIKVIANTRDVNSDIHELVVTVVDDQTGQTLLAEATAATKAVETHFITSTLTFEDPQNVADQPYGMVISLYAEDGSYLGAADTEVVVQGLTDTDDDNDTDFTVTGEASIVGSVNIYQVDATNYRLRVAVLSDSVARVDVELVDLVGNPAQPESVSMEPAGAFQQWVVRGRAGGLSEGSAAQVVVTALDAEGTELDVTGGLEEDVPTIMYSFGKGTRNAATSISSRPQLL